MSGARMGSRALFGVLLLLSGAAGLVYEQLWIRELQMFFGSTLHSITTVVAAYMGGLGLGAWWIGRRADRLEHPARLYGLLELAVGVFGLASPWLFEALGAGYLTLARATAPGLWTATAIKFVAAFVLMLVPTFLMGGTLPVLTRAFAGPDAAGLRRDLALFYGLNTVGGVLGCALAGYVLVEHVGVRPTLLATGALNVVLGVAALALARLRPSVAAAAPEQRTDIPDTVRRAAIVLITVTAFGSLLYEIAWTRVLILVVGSSTYAFTTILACFLLGIGLGSLLGGGSGLGFTALLTRLALVQGAIAATAALLFPFFRMLPRFIIESLQWEGLSPGQLIAVQSIPLALVILPPTIGMGIAFPLLAELAARREGHTGAETGRAYLANTLGSIAGSAVTGFLLVHLIGAERTLVAGVLLSGTAAAYVVWLLLRHGQRVEGPAAAGAAGLAVAAVLVTVLAPAWSSRLLDRGPAIYGHDLTTRAQQEDFLRGRGAEQLSFEEGWNATVSVWRSGPSTWLKTNGKADASSVSDMGTQVLLGMLPALAHPAPARAFVIGFGSGATARALADVPGVGAVDVAEIERAVVRAAPFFQSANRDILADPRVRIIEDDARAALQLASTPYDVIVSEPSNPWIAGIASLFTPEFFQVVRSRLAPGGVFAQWVQTYRVPVEVVATVAANLRSVFPHVELWFSSTSDLILVASEAPVRWDRDRVSAALAPGSPSADLMRDWLLVREPDDLLGRFLLGPGGVERLAAGSVLRHDDDRPALEFVAARGLLAATPASEVFDSLLALRSSSREPVPPGLGWQQQPARQWAALARVLPSSHTLALAAAESAVVVAPTDPCMRVALGRVLVMRRAYDAAIPHLEAAAADPRCAGDVLVALAAAVGSTDRARTRQLLERAQSASPDSVTAISLLAQRAADEQDWRSVERLVLRALRGARPTLEVPWPSALPPAVWKLAYEGPPSVGVPVLDSARARLPSWELAWHGGASALARSGACEQAWTVGRELTRFGWTMEEIRELLQRCPER